MRIPPLAAVAVLFTAAHVCFPSGPSDSAAATQQEQNPPAEAPAEHVYKNIQVFKGLPKSQLLPAMFFMEGSLNTSCTHCHNFEHFDNDDKAAKQTARKMILMMRQLNDSQFHGRPVISCNTCHRGQKTPDAPLTFAKVEEARPQAPASRSASHELPTADRLFARHSQAVGGAAALKKIDSRIMKGKRFSSEGWSSPVEIDQKAPDQWMTSFKLKAQFVEAFDGSRGWGQDGEGVHDANPKDLAQMRLDAEFYRDLELDRMFANARTVGRDRINGNDSYVVEAKSAEGAQKKLYFDVGTGLLVRIAGLDPSPFGPIPDAVDYADYREVDGIKLPFTISRLRPDYSLVDKLTQITQNVPLAKNRFAK